MDESWTRRQMLRAVEAALVGGALGAGAVTGAVGQRGESWPEFGYDSSNTGHAPTNTGPVEGVNDAWRFETGDPVNSSPAVAHDAVYIGNNEDQLHARDPASGDLQFTGWTDDKVGSPAVTNSTVYVSSYNRVLHGKSADSGSEVVRHYTDKQLVTAPTVVDGVIYLRSVDGSIYALDADSGQERWHLEVEDSTGTPSAPAVTDGVVYTGGVAGTVCALDASSGEVQWRFETDGRIQTSPAVADDVVYFGSDGAYALRAGSGEKLWHFPAEYSRSSPAVVDGTVYIGGGDTVYALDATSGTEQWRFETDDRVASSPAVVDGMVYIGSNDGNLYALTSGPDRVGSASAASTTTTPQEESSANPVWPMLTILAVGLPSGLWYWRRNVGETVPAASDGRSEPTADRDGLAPPEVEATPNDSEDPDGAPMGPPESIPRAREVAVDYDALTDEEPIGGGGNADVTKATLPTPDCDEILAIKRPRMQGTLHADAVDRLLQEAETWDKLDDHDHVVGVIDYGAEPLPWIAMEYMDAGDLGERAGALPFEQARWTAVAITKAVRHAHRRGVAHLDLKPANVLFRSVDGAWDVPKVADWGLSKHLLEHSESVEGLSPQYAAPEQFDTDRGPADDLTDVYQLGAVCYELFTGRPPFEGDPTSVMHQVLHEDPEPPSEVADLPPALDEVLLTALATAKADRYESVLYLRDALQTVSQG